MCFHHNVIFVLVGFLGSSGSPFSFTVPELVEGLVIPELLFVGMVEDKKKYQI